MAPVIEAAYLEAGQLSLLTEVNVLFLRTLSSELGLEATFFRTEAIPRVAEDPTGRLVEICVARGATTYVSGPAAKTYIEKAQFDRSGIALAYADYSNYPVYDQGTTSFEHGVSMLDLLFRLGPAARQHLKSISKSVPFLTPEL